MVRLLLVCWRSRRFPKRRNTGRSRVKLRSGARFTLTLFHILVGVFRWDPTITTGQTNTCRTLNVLAHLSIWRITNGSLRLAVPMTRLRRFSFGISLHGGRRLRWRSSRVLRSFWRKLARMLRWRLRVSRPPLLVILNMTLVCRWWNTLETRTWDRLLRR